MTVTVGWGLALAGVLPVLGIVFVTGAAQVLVLLGIMAGQACTVALFGALVRRALIVPADLVPALHP